MLRLERREISEVLDGHHLKALKSRVTSAQKLVARTEIGSARTTRIRDQWNNFRQGKTSKGTFAILWKELCTMSFEKCALCEVPHPSTVEHKEAVSMHAERAFDWENLLPACGDCNRMRENSGITAPPIDPSEVDPLEYLGWDEYGKFTPNPRYKDAVRAHVDMYGLDRFDDERKAALLDFRELLLTIATADEEPRQSTIDRVRSALTATRAWRGPIREFLLRPPTFDDEWLVTEALNRLPDIHDLVKPWLRPGPGAKSRWA